MAVNHVSLTDLAGCDVVIDIAFHAHPIVLSFQGVKRSLPACMSALGIVMVGANQFKLEC